MQLSEVMTRELVTLRRTDSLDTAQGLVANKNVWHLPVVEGKKLLGLLTHRDLLRLQPAREGKAPPVRQVEEVMTRTVVTLRPDTSVREAIRLMLRGKLGCIPVTDDTGNLLGLVTGSDLLRVADRWLDQLDRQELAAEYDA